MALTKQDLESIRGVVKTEIKSEISTQLDIKLAPIQKDIDELKQDVRGLREQIQQLTITLDNFVKIMTDFQEEFTILKAEVDQIKKILKEKLGVEVMLQK